MLDHPFERNTRKDTKSLSTLDNLLSNCVNAKIESISMAIKKIIDFCECAFFCFVLLFQDRNIKKEYLCVPCMK